MVLCEKGARQGDGAYARICSKRGRGLGAFGSGRGGSRVTQRGACPEDVVLLLDDGMNLMLVILLIGSGSLLLLELLLELVEALELAVGPSRDAVLATLLLERGDADAELAGGGIDGEVEVTREVKIRKRTATRRGFVAERRRWASRRLGRRGLARGARQLRQRVRGRERRGGRRLAKRRGHELGGRGCVRLRGRGRCHGDGGVELGVLDARMRGGTNGELRRRRGGCGGCGRVVFYAAPSDAEDTDALNTVGAKDCKPRGGGSERYGCESSATEHSRRAEGEAAGVCGWRGAGSA